VNLRTRLPEPPEINLTPLVDVVLLLIIFFMASTTFVKEAPLQVELPQASQEPVSAGASPLEVTITVDGGYLVNGQALVNSRPDTLRRALERTAGERRDLPLVIRADARAAHQSVVTAMDVAGRLGFVHLSIATVNTQENP
jgi:biopolymer transport protein ExbD